MKKAGWVILVAVVLVFASAESQPSRGETGRYQLYIPGEMIGRVVLLDTTTGQTWHQVQYTSYEGEPTVWAPTAPRVNSEPELRAWEMRQTVKKTSDKEEPK